MTAASTLRDAATRLREVARAAEARRWYPSDAHEGMDEIPWREIVSDLPGDDQVNEFVESWPPSNGIKLADWLDYEATMQDLAEQTYERYPTPDNAAMCAPNGFALSLARSILGETGESDG